MEKIHSVGQLANVPIISIEMEFVCGIWLPIQIPTDQLVILWVYPFKVLSTRKDENYFVGRTT